MGITSSGLPWTLQLLLASMYRYKVTDIISPGKFDSVYRMVFRDLI